jgi:hypothetical protein
MSNNDNALSRSEVQTRMLAYMAQHCHPTTGRLNDGVVKYVMDTYKYKNKSYSRRGITSLWNKHKKVAMNVNKPLAVVRKKGSGRKRKIPIEQLKAMVKAVPFSKRSKVRSLSKELNMSKSTLHRALQLGVLQRSTSAVKPILTEQNKQARIAWVKSKVAEDGRFVDMMNEVHIDEKWFYITREKESYIIVEGESVPERKVKSKRFITKIMFLAAFARPRVINEVTGEMWDGKIGIWPFVTTVIAQRSSVNRPAGTPVTKSINVDRVVSRKFYKEKLAPAILAKSAYFTDGATIYQQQDNAKPHPLPNDQEMNEFYDKFRDEYGVDIRLMNQTANSPDVNTLDLAFFRAIQSLQQEIVSNSIDELIEHVEKAYWDLPLETCEKVWVTLQMVMNEIIINGGNNGYRLPHMGKDKIMRELGTKIPYRLPCPALAVPGQSLNGPFVKAWMQHMQAAAALTDFAAPPPLEEANPPVAEEVTVEEVAVEEVVPPLLPPVAAVEDPTSPTGVAEVAEEQIQAAAAAQRLDIEEVRHDDSMFTIEEADDDDDPDDDEVAIEKDVVDAASRIALLQKVLETFWVNMDIDTWNSDHGDYDHAAIEGADELPPQQEEHVMDGRMNDKNHHRQNLERPVAVQFGGGQIA